MKVINQTDFNSETLENMTKQVTKGFTNKIKLVIFRYTRKSKFRGWCKYPYRELDIDIGKNNTYPLHMNNWHGQYFPKYEIKNDLEMLYSVLLHETRHFWLYLHNKKNTECRVEKWVHKKFEEWKTSPLYIEWHSTINQPNPILEPKPQPTKEEKNP